MISTLFSLAREAGHDLSARAVSMPEKVREALEGGWSSFSGRSVTSQSALQVAAVWACVNVRSLAVAQLPLLTYRRRPEGDGKERAADHYAYRLLRWRANPYMTAFRFKRQMQTYLDLTGNAFAELEVSGRGQVLALWPWRPDRVRVEQSDEGVPLYFYRGKNGQEYSRPWYLMLHLRGLSTDGLMGMSPIAAHRQQIGAALAQTEHAARFYANGARPLGVLKHPGKLVDAKKLRESWERVHGGLSNAHRVAILEEGMDYKEVSMTMVDAQFLEVMQYGVSDIARIFNVPPHKIGDLTRATNNNIEHQGIEWLQDGLGPELANWEQELTNSLLSDREQQSIEFEFLLNALMRTDSKSRGEYFAKARQWGWMSANDIRRAENMNPVDGGDEYLTPLNMTPVGTEREETK